MSFPEDFLHYIWKFRLFSQQELKTTSGENLDIISVGLHNKDAGPDFESARIRIGNTLWAGNVEIHILSSDWNRHQHQFDLSYDNVILHVVARHDQEIKRTDGTQIPVLIIADLIPARIAENYFMLMAGMNWIPCEKQLIHTDRLHLNNWLSRILIERIEEKSYQINQLLQEFKGSWDDAFYITLARNFGFKTNALPFEMLARSLPQKLLARYKNRSLPIEALIFGQAGFLNADMNADMNADYPQRLRNEYLFLKKKHDLQPIDSYLWKYMRLRPRNFPSLRLAQFAALVLKSNHLFSRILKEPDIKNIIQMFHKLPVNKYWESHYRFGLQCRKTSAALGIDAIDNILINTISVFLFAFGMKTGSNSHMERGLNILENLKPERNGIIRRFNETGVFPESAYFSQALIQLKKSYCDEKKCLSCGIGIKILNQ